MIRMEAIATGRLPVIITEQEENLQTVVPEIVERTGAAVPWLAILIVLLIVIALVAGIILVFVMGKKRGKHQIQREKGDRKSAQKAPYRAEPIESAGQYDISRGSGQVVEDHVEVAYAQTPVPDRNSQVYPEILLVNLDQPEIIYRTNISEHVVIGRREGSDIRITTDTAVSSRHCMISVKGTQFYLEDCNSTNGTRYNDQEVTTQIPILNGGILEIGRARYRLVIGC